MAKIDSPIFALAAALTALRRGTLRTGVVLEVRMRYEYQRAENLMVVRANITRRHDLTAP